MGLGEWLKVLWIEFSKGLLEDCRFYFMPWARMRREGKSYKNR